MPEATSSPRHAEVSAEALKRLHRSKGLVFDMDGTLVLGDKRNNSLRPLPGSIEITRFLRQQRTPFVLFTNGTTRTPAAYAQTLCEAGFDFVENEVLTPASSAVDAFLAQGYRKVMVLGGAGLTEPLQQAGIEVVPPQGKAKVDAVLIGWYREFTMDCLEAACHAVWEGASLYSASQAQFFATAEGRALGTSRAIAAMIRDTTGCRVQIVGKPSLHALRTAGQRLGISLKDLAVVGDDPLLEVPMAHRGKALAVAVNSGLGNELAFAGMAPSRRPHITVSGVDELLNLYRQ
jgi:4-nitrophenyl phosphatase